MSTELEDMSKLAQENWVSVYESGAISHAGIVLGELAAADAVLGIGLDRHNWLQRYSPEDVRMDRLGQAIMQLRAVMVQRNVSAKGFIEEAVSLKQG